MSMRALLILSLIASAGLADTVVLKSGLRLHGAVEEGKEEVKVSLDGKTWTLPRERIRAIRPGESPVEEFSRRAAALGEDAAGWYRLALWARESKLPRVEEALRRVIEIEPDHRAARRELGYEKVEGEWVGADEARRRKGFVKCRGKWVLPAEADRLMREGLMEQADVTAEHRRRAEEIVMALEDEDAEVRRMAADLLEEVPDAALVRPLKRSLYAPDPGVRKLAIKTLGRIGDRTALPWLIRSSMYDADKDVRNTAYRSVKGFKDADVFYPYARALFSKSPRASVMAANALGALGDLRGVDVILRRVHIGIGESPRVHMMVGKQQSYISDFDVEIAQAAAIGDPIVQTIRDGIILDFKVLGGHGEAWVVERYNAYAGALRNITGRDYGKDWGAWAKYAQEAGLPKANLK